MRRFVEDQAQQLRRRERGRARAIAGFVVDAGADDEQEPSASGATRRIGDGRRRRVDDDAVELRAERVDQPRIGAEPSISAGRS